MDKLKAVRGGHRSAVTRQIHKTDEKINEGEITRRDIHSAIENLERKHELLQKLDAEILDSLDAESVEQEILDADEFNQHIDINIRRYKECDLELRSSTPQDSVSQLTSSIVQNTSTTHSSSNNFNQNTNQHMQTSASANSQGEYEINRDPPLNETYKFYHKLPKLDLPTFSGDLLLWQTFWESYETTVHTNPSLTNVQRFTYLKAQLHGEAESCISGLSLTHANYEQAISLLQARYGQQGIIIDAHMQKLVDLPNPTMSLNSLRTFYDKVETSIRGLESLGQCQTNFGTVLTPIIFRKLPPELRTTLTREHDTSTWTIDLLRKAIGKELRAQQAGHAMNTDNLTPTASFVTKATMKGNYRQVNRVHTNSRNNTESNKPKPCIFCNKSHSAVDCSEIKDNASRYEIVKKKQLCFNCFGKHKISECRSRYKCRKCDKRHHTALCNQETQAPVPPADAAAVNTVNVNGEESNPMSTFYTSTPQAQAHTEILLKTAVAPVWFEDRSAMSNILLDEGSQKSFISEDLAAQLQLKPCGNSTISLSTFGNANQNVRHMDKAQITLEIETGGFIPMDVLIVPRIAAPLSNVTNVIASKLPYLKGLRLANPVTEDRKFELSLLIGADYYWSIVQDHVIRGDGPTAVKSRLGYLLSGPMHTFTGEQSSTGMFNVLIQHQQEESSLEKFWDLESIGVKADELETTTMKDFNDEYETKCITYQDNRYTAKLPWRNDFNELPTNYNVTLRRTCNMIDRLKKDTNMLKMYGDIIKDQKRRGFIERVTENGNQSNRIHYIPHHAVKKDSSTTPIRIVYDCSCHESPHKASLNDCLMSVPPMLNDLTGILARFRLHKHAVTTDIEKAFLNVELDKEDRDVTRFFWLSDPSDPDSPLITYRFRVVLFGTTCSPYILNATLMKHFKLNSCKTAEILKNDLYVDNVLSSFWDEKEMLKFYRESRDLLARGGFNLRSWTSNSTELLRLAQSEKCIERDTNIKILGLRWNVNNDQISFRNNINTTTERIITKREILKQSSNIYDPLGLLSPVTVRTKMLMQLLWKEKFAWDCPLPKEIESTWSDLTKDLQFAMNIEIPRCYFECSGITDIETAELHIFTDSSQLAYGTCAYLVTEKESALVMAKNRVAPLKSVTLPNLELMAALLGARLAKHLIQNLHIGNLQINFWCDSQIVLKWLQSTKPLKKFVANRVKEIKESNENQKWRYCPTDANPADLLTRGITGTKFINNRLWFHGPEWITDKTQWPTWSGNEIVENENIMEIPTNETSEKQHVLLTSQKRQEFGIHKIMDIERYSSLKTLIRVTAYVMRFIQNCKLARSDRTLSELTVNEIQHATLTWIQTVQKSEYHEVFNYFNKSVTVKPSIVRQLNLYFDEENALRCRGRIQHAPLEESAKHPYLLPPLHRLTSLIIMDAHINHLHEGVNSTVTHLRQVYWIPRIRQRVKVILRKCVNCRKVTGHAYQQPDPPPLPKERLHEDIPFTVTGVDFAGPMYVRNTDDTKSKVYLCLFTCASTRAVHLELVNNLSEPTFMLAFRRFASRRSLPKLLISDNALTFEAASREIKHLTNSNSVRESLSSTGTNWKFITKKAPWFGGFYERLIGLTKMCLKKVLGSNCVDLETLQTVLTEIEATLNDRPLTYVSSDLTDPEPLTPSHLLYGRKITRLPYPASENNGHFEPINFNKRVQLQRDILNHFQQRWKYEYLTSLREHHRSVGNNEQSIAIGDVVQIHDETLRNSWKLAVVEELVKGEDNLIRTVKLRTKNGTTNRPITKLYPIEVNCIESEPEDVTRPKMFRQAKSDAVQKIHEWTK